MFFSIRVMTCLLAYAVMSGCAANDLMLKRLSESEAKIEHLIQTGKKNEQRLNEFAAQLHGQNERINLSSVQFKQLQDAILELRASQLELKARASLLAQQTPAPKVEIVNPAPANSGRETGPPADYLKAFGLYSANNFAAAIESFETFIKLNQKSDYVSNAIYWVGECYYSLSDLPKAREAFFNVSVMYPNSPKAADALLKLGYTLAAMKEKEKALAVFDSLIKSYPSSPAAIKARERLNAN